MLTKANKLNVIVFGIGQIFHLLKSVLYDVYNVVAFADNDLDKQGTFLDGIEVINPKYIFSQQFDKVVIMTTGFQKYVVKQLNDYGVDSNDIILGVNFLLKSSDKSDSKYEYYVDDGFDVAFRYRVSKCKNVLIENNDFNWIISSNDAVILPSIISGDGFSEEELNAFFLLSNEFFGETNGVFLDVGANVGTTSLLATKNRRVSEVIAIEPSVENFSLLQCNVILNKLQEKIHLVNAVASDKNGITNLLISPVLPSDNRAISVLNCSRDEEIEKILSITIDTLISDRSASEIAFMWIDVQGYEYYVLNGAKTLISMNKNLAILIEFWPFGLKDNNCLDLLCQFCKENFSKYIDIKEYLERGRIVHEINSIDLLHLTYEKTHTDLFLIP